MPVHAGFAYAVQIRRKVLNDAMLLAYHAERISRRLVASLLDGPPDVGVDFYLDPPSVSFDTANPGGFLLTITGVGRLSIDFSTTFPEARTVKVRMVLLIHPRFAVTPGALVLSPLREDVTLLTWAFSIVGGAPFSPNANTYLTGPVFKDRLEASLALGLTAGLLDIPPIRIAALGSAFAIASTTSVSRVLDESVLIGLNLDEGPVRAVGEIQELTSFAGSHDIALVLNPAVLPVVFADALAELDSAVAAEGATLDALVITPGNGKIGIAGSASNEFGSVDFSLDAVLAMFASRSGKYFQYIHRPVQVNARIWPAVNFKVENVHVDVHPARWVRVVQALGAVFTGAVVPLFIQDLIRGAAQQVTLATRQAPVGSSIPRVQHLEPIREGDPRVKMRINDFSISPDAIFCGLGVAPKLPAPVLMGPESIPANYLARKIRYRLIPPIGVFEDDPALRVRWQVQDLDSGQLLVDDDGAAAARLTREFRVADFGLVSPQLAIACQLYRRIGFEVTPVFSDGVRLAISPPLLPGALIRWRYQVLNPQVSFSERDQEWKYLGETHVNRWSALHRLDRPCRMVAERSRYGGSGERLDDIPYPLAEVANRREGLCSYCFFGGPGDRRRPVL
jgi:hypothetical protein